MPEEIREEELLAIAEELEKRAKEIEELLK